MMKLETRDSTRRGRDPLTPSGFDKQMASITSRLDRLAKRAEACKRQASSLLLATAAVIAISGVGIFLYSRDTKGSLRVINLPSYVVRDGSIERTMDYGSVAGKYLARVEEDLAKCKVELAEAAKSPSPPPRATPPIEDAVESAVEGNQQVLDQTRQAAIEGVVGPKRKDCKDLENGVIYMRAQAVMLEAPGVVRHHGASFTSDVKYLIENREGLGFFPEDSTMEQLATRANWLVKSKQPKTTSASDTWKWFIGRFVAPFQLFGGLLLGYGWLLGERVRRLRLLTSGEDANKYKRLMRGSSGINKNASRNG